MRKKTLLFLLGLSVLIGGCLWSGVGQAATFEQKDDTRVILLSYGRIEDQNNKENSISINDLKKHIKVIVDAKIPVLPLPKVITAMKGGAGLPPHGVVFVLDGAYRSTLSQVIPVLREYKLPYTLVYAAQDADFPGKTALSWQDLREISKDPHASLAVTLSGAEDFATLPGLEVMRLLNKAKTRHREELKTEPEIFVYPGGQYTPDIKTKIMDQGYLAALGAQAGPVWAGSDLFALPQFTITQDTAGHEHFAVLLAARPLPVSDLEPTRPMINTTTPSIGFTLPPHLTGLAGMLRCFATGQKAPKIERLGTGRIEIRLQKPVNLPLTRVNCMMPYQKTAEEEPESTAWRWLGFVLLWPQALEGQDIP